MYDYFETMSLNVKYKIGPFMKSNSFVENIFKIDIGDITYDK